MGIWPQLVGRATHNLQPLMPSASSSPGIRRTVTGRQDSPQRAVAAAEGPFVAKLTCKQGIPHPDTIPHVSGPLMLVIARGADDLDEKIEGTIDS
jgi:hypothetical protein